MLGLIEEKHIATICNVRAHDNSFSFWRQTRYVLYKTVFSEMERAMKKARRLWLPAGKNRKSTIANGISKSMLSMTRMYKNV